MLMYRSGDGRYYPAQFHAGARYTGDGFLSSVGKVFSKIAAPLSIAAEFIPGGSLVKGGIKTAVSVLKSPVGKAAVAGTALVSAGQALLPSTKSVSGLPALPTGGAMAAAPTGGSSGLLGLVKGPGGRLQWPWQDPTELFKYPYALDDSYLTQRLRAPRGYVVVRDAKGRAYGMMKGIARQLGLWKAHRKPPISAGDWHKYQTAQAVEKKLRRLAVHALRKHHKQAAHGQIVKFHRKAA